MSCLPVLTHRSQTEPKENLMLSLLCDREYKKVAATLEPVELSHGDVLWEVGEDGDFVYFPTSAVLSLDYESDQGETVSIALIGRNVVAGHDVATGNTPTSDRAVVVVAGEAWRMPRREAQTEMNEHGDFQHVFSTCASGMLKKIAQNAVCNRLHHIDQQICRLLLDISDESSCNEITLTHQRLSELLGIRRESVSVSLSKLIKQKAIDCQRGCVAVKSRDRLRTAACECYEMSKEFFATAIESHTSH